tara:strand:- start:80 stop:469 length:390 start_codon:yes stop_codon:yes gene_type:complete
LKLEGWEAKLNQAISETGEFQWGTNDCCMFAVRVVEALTGEDHSKPYKGYKTAKGAASRLLKHGGVEGIATKQLGECKKPILAKRGDVVSFKTNDQIALGICVGDKIAAVSEAGLITLSMREAINAWSI